MERKLKNLMLEHSTASVRKNRLDFMQLNLYLRYAPANATFELLQRNTEKFRVNMLLKREFQAKLRKYLANRKEKKLLHVYFFLECLFLMDQTNVCWRAWT